MAYFFPVPSYAVAMRFIWGFCAVAALVVFPALLRAQDDEKTFKAAVLHKQLFLRNFTAEDEIRGEWVDGQLQIAEPGVRTLGAFVAEQISIKADKIVLEGRRHTLERVSDTKVILSAGGEQVRIQIGTNGVALSTVLPALTDGLFFPSPGAAIAALPARYHELLPAPVDKKCCSKPPAAPTQACDCADLTANGCQATQLAMEMQGMKPLKLVHGVDPEMSEEARKNSYNGLVELSFDVDAGGHTDNLWIMKSAGLGLDGNAAKAVHSYRFSPATCHDSPVTVQIYANVKFEFSQ
jgi:TonB family protein